MTGEPRSGRRTEHLLKTPRRIRLIEHETGAHEALEIDGDDGVSLRIRFRSVIPSEMVDGG